MYIFHVAEPKQKFSVVRKNHLSRYIIMYFVRGFFLGLRSNSGRKIYRKIYRSTLKARESIQRFDSPYLLKLKTSRWQYNIITLFNQEEPSRFFGLSHRDSLLNGYTRLYQSLDVSPVNFFSTLLSAIVYSRRFLHYLLLLRLRWLTLHYEYILTYNRYIYT